MTILKNPDQAIERHPIPEWLVAMFPQLSTIPELQNLPQVVVDELEAARVEVHRVREVLRSMLASQSNQSAPGITWSERVERNTFAKTYVKNFRLRITMRDHEMYRESRAPQQALTTSFGNKPRDCAPYLTNQTWAGFYQDIDDGLAITHTKIPTDMIEASINGSGDVKSQACEQINTLLVPTVIYLRTHGYALYPDLVL